MGPYIKLTNRLVLRVENETKAKEVLALYQRNRFEFESFEPTRPANFYTLDYHINALRREYKAYTLGTFLRYYIYSADNMSKIIGAVNFNLYRYGETPYAEIGYKMDSLNQRRGYTFEACTAAIDVISTEYGINRIDARIHPDNVASIGLAAKMGFKPLCLEPQSANILGKNVDIIRYTLDTSHIQ